LDPSVDHSRSASSLYQVLSHYNNKGRIFSIGSISGVIQVDIGGHPPSPTGPKHVSGNFGNLLFLAVFNFWGHFEALNDVF
jgi:hypothetical protein